MLLETINLSRADAETDACVGSVLYSGCKKWNWGERCVSRQKQSIDQSVDSFRANKMSSLLTGPYCGYFQVEQIIFGGLLPTINKFELVWAVEALRKKSFSPTARLFWRSFPLPYLLHTLLRHGSVMEQPNPLWLGWNKESRIFITLKKRQKLNDAINDDERNMHNIHQLNVHSAHWLKSPQTSVKVNGSDE